MKEVTLTNGMKAIVDDEDFELVSQHHWTAFFREGTYYANASIGGRTITLHQFLLGGREGLKIDHKNGNGLDNQRSNLRHATHAQNMRNRRAQSAHAGEQHVRVPRGLLGQASRKISRADQGGRPLHWLGKVSPRAGRGACV
jgi:hypothetical protein